MSGIVSYGADIPYWRLQRSAITSALGSGGGRGTRSVASYDEDTTSLAVEAGRAAFDQKLDSLNAVTDESGQGFADRLLSLITLITQITVTLTPSMLRLPSLALASHLLLLARRLARTPLLRRLVLPPRRTRLPRASRRVVPLLPRRTPSQARRAASDCSSAPPDQTTHFSL
jgi:hypothetical protein